ncbi:MAG TPA: M12 family metallo-peptidase [Pyrinomonadaceae bacterium]|jgi:hypothetical protein
MRKTPLRALFIAAIAIGFFWNFSNPTDAQTAAALFTIVDKPQKKGETEKYSVASINESEININLKKQSEVNKERLSFPLFDGKTYEAKRESVEIRKPDDFTWRGKITFNEMDGDVILTFKEGFVSGLIYAGNSVYEIASKGDGAILVELNQNLFPECAGGFQGEKQQTSVQKTPSAGADSGDRIDVLVLYTAEVKNSLGGDAQTRVFAQQAIDATNTAYINSKIRQRVNLVHAQETAIIETGNLATELSALRTNADAAVLRNNYNADLVALLSNTANNCGQGYLIGSANGNAGNGFTVTSRGCAVGNLSFAHELGHNMGSQHNPENGTNSAFSYGYGHYVNGVFRTVMSYVDPCAQGCTRRPYFSNPAVSFGGYPTGLDDERDNVRLINSTADVIANYRFSGKSLTLNNFSDGETIPRRISRQLKWSSENVTGNVKIELSRDGGTTWERLIENTANDGSETISISGRPTRYARLRIISLENPLISDSSVKNISIR